MPEPVFSANTAGLTQLFAAMALASREAMDRLWKVLSQWGAEYQQRVKAVVPVDDGTLRMSIQLLRERTDTNMTVIVGTSQKGKDGNAPYPVFLEMGTAKIAGGRVAAWQPGDPPILDWPAKLAEANHKTGVSRDIGGGAAGRVRNTRGQFISAKLGSRAEQMPFFRPIGYEIAPKVIEDCRDALNDTLKDRLDGRKF